MGIADNALFATGRHSLANQTPAVYSKAMALDPEKAFLDYSAADCSVQFWTANAPAVQFTSLEAAVRFAKDHGGRWEEIEITVHLPREDIVFATGKVHQLIDALPGDLRKKR
ncbi:hypothetical protein LZK78_09940 [Rhizobium leguminosarum]|nr:MULTISPECIES: hypothetical protein [Rhizobium]UIJ81585.1 hypothetical protein LZK78_09940 [Rhizobium leguminosarum]